MVEDNAQDAPDHVDAHRSPGCVISAYTKRHAVGRKFYNTINMLRTIEDLLGMKKAGMNDANADPMSDVFDTEADPTPYKAVLPGSFCQAPVNTDLIPECKDSGVLRTRALPAVQDGAWWAKATKQINFKRLDRLDAEAFNRLLRRGTKGEDKPYPVRPSARRDADE